MKNPKWHRDEIILALDLYFNEDRGTVQASNPKIIELSELLNKLPIHEIPDNRKFRNANGVSLKLSNFMAIDPLYLGKGMTAYSKLDEEIFLEFVNKKKQLSIIAASIKSIVLNPTLNYNLHIIENEDENENESAKEGRVLYKFHKYKERNKDIVKKKKERYLKKYGKLNCEICDFDFAVFYGNVGEGFIECHHKKALAELINETITELDDLILVCPNCHRMLHRRLGRITIEELRNIIESQGI